MNSSYNLDSILDAIENINNKSKQKSKPTAIEYKKIEEKNTSINQNILPATEKLILEAEEYSNNIKNKTLNELPPPEDVLVLDVEYKVENKTFSDLEEIKLNIIDDLYSTLSKKVKKNTLKVIFELRQQITSLEEEIKNINYKKKDNENVEDKNNFNLKDEHLINENTIEAEYDTVNYNNVDLPTEVIETLKLQNTIIKKLEANEEKLLLKIVELEQDVTILGNKKKNIIEEVSEESINKLNNNFDKGNKIINQQNAKTKKELIFFKENYERMIIENDKIKIKLSNSKERIIFFEQNVKELENSFENLRNILSKNSVIKLNDPLLKTYSNVDQSKKDDLK